LHVSVCWTAALAHRARLLVLRLRQRTWCCGAGRGNCHPQSTRRWTQCWLKWQSMFRPQNRLPASEPGHGDMATIVVDDPSDVQPVLTSPREMEMLDAPRDSSSVDDTGLSASLGSVPLRFMKHRRRSFAFRCRRPSSVGRLGYAGPEHWSPFGRCGSVNALLRSHARRTSPSRLSAYSCRSWES
jgi:hypothetical protein